MTQAAAAEKEEFTLIEAADYLRGSLEVEKFSTRKVERLNLPLFYRSVPGSPKQVRFWKKTTLDEYIEKEKGKVKESHSGELVKADNNPITQEDFTKGLMMLAQVFETKVKQLAPAAEPKSKKMDIAAFKDKLILNFKQALAYSGLHKADLTEALESKAVKGKFTEKTMKVRGNAIIVKVWQINRQSLDEFCKNFGS